MARVEKNKNKPCLLWGGVLNNITMDKIINCFNSLYRGKIYTLIAVLLVWMGAIGFGVLLCKTLGLESFLFRWVLITPFTIVALSMTKDLLQQRFK